MNALTVNLIGWASAAILLATLVVQVVRQWHDRNSRGVSRWLFVGQLAASLGFIVYSAFTDNMVFVVTNSLIAAVAIFGQYAYYRNKRTAKR